MPARRKRAKFSSELPLTAEAAKRQGQFNLVAAYVHATRQVRPEYLLGPSRGSRHLSQARQELYYLSHVGFGLSFTQIGDLTTRDRTSVAHGVRQVEDSRDDPQRDRALHFAEAALVAFFEANWEAANDTGE